MNDGNGGAERTDAPEVGPDTTTGAPSEPGIGEEVGPNAGDAWRDVVAALDSLGESIGRWARAAVDDPENKRRMHELRERVDELGRKAGDAFGNAAESSKDVADRASEKLREVGGRIGDEVAPRMASAFKSAADRLRDAAERMEDKAGADSEATESESEEPSKPTDDAEG